jgi:hypothetical protein
MPTLKLDNMARSSRRRARGVGLVSGNEVRLTADQYRYVCKTGLGDRVEAVLNGIGVASLVKRWRPACGCIGRRERLNRWAERVGRRFSQAFKTLKRWIIESVR